ncbi:glycerophosphodiester phosphodiesterase family protein [Chitinophaga sp. S165]|uniref:glycerophosphodiester phosphodiesterase n=1 Tax=Chitinophaga sp. S165 TaxID=2135462 RepID=UPI000D717339|nr:glycerophosphodiester phosphodiesterase family protein [Chitinophaga sp. S165]PWV56145.1 glycerophosphoryl diester phosphodiesterase family protein [Chitinophaga sp. S165]
MSVTKKISALLVFLLCSLTVYCQSNSYLLIAHRGGVVDSLREENSMEALQEAGKRGYYMIEVDVRLTSDSILVTHHDANLKRTFGIDTSLSAMTWKALSILKNNNGYRILSFEDVLKAAKGRLQIMIDLKIRGNHPAIFG